MIDFFSKLFSADFMPHGHCFYWQADILWLHVISDVAIAIAYFTIPLALITLVRKRSDLAFDWMFGMFAAFIFLCGTTHLVEVWTMWHPVYRIQGAIKLITAAVSLVTAALLWRLLPRALALPSIEQLEEQLALRRQMGEELQAAQRMASIGVLAAGIAHEINNPVGVIVLSAQNALAQSETDDPRSVLKHLCEKVLAQADRCSRIVKGVLHYSRQQPTEKWRQDVNALVNGTVQLLSDIIRSSHATVKLRLAEALPDVIGNPIALEQVIHDLLQNAINSVSGSVELSRATLPRVIRGARIRK